MTAPFLDEDLKRKTRYVSWSILRHIGSVLVGGIIVTFDIRDLVKVHPFSKVWISFEILKQKALEHWVTVTIVCRVH